MLNTTADSAACILAEIVRSLVSFPEEVAVNVLDKEHEVTLVLCLDDRDLRAEGSLSAMTLRSLRVMLYAFAPRAGKPVTLEVEATKRYSSQPLFQIKQV